jgi:hypothetical protein
MGVGSSKQKGAGASKQQAGAAPGSVVVSLIKPKKTAKKLGLRLHVSLEQVTVRWIFPDTLAGDSGQFSVGDVVTHINATSLAGMNNQQVMAEASAAGSIAFTITKAPVVDTSALRKAFDIFDTDGSGELDKAEFRAVMTMSQEDGDDQDVALSEGEFELMFAQVDTDGTGSISFEEYLAWTLEGQLRNSGGA